jgi:hypothetical protein
MMTLRVVRRAELVILQDVVSWLSRFRTFDARKLRRSIMVLTLLTLNLEHIANEHEWNMSVNTCKVTYNGVFDSR